MDAAAANPEPNDAAPAESAAQPAPAPRFGGRSPPRARVGRSPPRAPRVGRSPPRAPRAGAPCGAERPASRSSATEMGLKYGSYVPTQREIDSGEVVVQEVVAVHKMEHVETAALELGEGEGDDWAAAVKVVADNMFSKDWNVRFDTLRALRMIVKFEPAALTLLINDVGRCLLECLKNPRSAIIREVCMLAADLLSSDALMDAVCAELNFEKLVPALLLKRINDKNFIREAANYALDTHAGSAPHMFHVYLSSCEHRNPKVAVGASATVSNCLSNVDHVAEELMGDLTVRMVKVCLHGKLADTRSSGKRCLELLEKMPSATTLESRLDTLCCIKDRVAVRRLLHPEEIEGSPKGRNTSLSELIAKSPTHSPKMNSNKEDIMMDDLVVLEKPTAFHGLCGGPVNPNDPPVTVLEPAQDAVQGLTRSRRSSEEIISLF